MYTRIYNTVRYGKVWYGGSIYILYSSGTYIHPVILLYQGSTVYPPYAYPGRPPGAGPGYLYYTQDTRFI
jgi:hypothetical protein